MHICVGNLTIIGSDNGFKEMHLNVLSAKWQPFCLGIHVLTVTHGANC